MTHHHCDIPEHRCPEPECEWDDRNPPPEKRRGTLTTRERGGTEVRMYRSTLIPNTWVCQGDPLPPPSGTRWPNIALHEQYWHCEYHHWISPDRYMANQGKRFPGLAETPPENVEEPT